MKNGKLGSFLGGFIIGAVFVTSAVAAIVPFWRKADVKPVVLVEYDQLYDFRPVGSDSPLAPSWPKEKVTPVALLKFDQLYDFVPLKSGTLAGLSPSWKKENVIPWVEVVVDKTGDFIPRHAP
jgi:hypothetical protein